ncbi:hypothetical protein RB200_36545 [Streptomyces sp. PmtG]
MARAVVLGAGPLDWSLVDGAVPVTLRVLGALGLAVLLCSRRRRWWTRLLPAALAVAALLAFLVPVVVDDWWQPFPDALPTDVVVWIGVALLGVCLALFRLPAARWRGRAGALVAGALVVVLGLNEVNIHYDNYPTARTLLGPRDTVGFKEAAGAKEPMLQVERGKALSEVWRAPAGLPGQGHRVEDAHPGHQVALRRARRVRLSAARLPRVAAAAAARARADGGPARLPGGLDHLRPAAGDDGRLRRRARGARAGRPRRRSARRLLRQPAVPGLAPRRRADLSFRGRAALGGGPSPGRVGAGALGDLRPVQRRHLLPADGRERARAVRLLPRHLRAGRADARQQDRRPSTRPSAATRPRSRRSIRWT